MRPPIPGLAALVVLVGTSAAFADVINGSFETGDFTGWETSGRGGAYPQVTTTDPTDGLYRAELGSYQPGSGFSSCDLGQDFTASAGDVLFFDYRWQVFAEGLYSGANANITLYDVTAGTLTLLFDYAVPGNPSGSSDWETLSHPISETSEYRLDFHTSASVLEDNFSSSGAWLGVDNVWVTPEPSTLTLLALAALGLLGCACRRRNR
jgi:hypothetical protein